LLFAIAVLGLALRQGGTNGEEESTRFPRACLSAAHQVVTIEPYRYRMALDRSGCRVPHKFNVAPYNRVKGKLVKVGKTCSCYFLARLILDLDLDVIILGEINSLFYLRPKKLQLSCFDGFWGCLYFIAAFLCGLALTLTKVPIFFIGLFLHCDELRFTFARLLIDPLSLAGVIRYWRFDTIGPLLLPSAIRQGVELKDEMQNEINKQDEKDFEFETAGFHYASDNLRRGLISTVVVL
jgi:hypothetical protein